MKKLIITLEYPSEIGGVQTYIHQFATVLDPESVVVLAPKHKLAQEFDVNNKFKTVRKKMLWPIFIWPRWTKMFWQVLRIIKKEKIEIIYLHHVLPVGYVAWLIKKIKKIPYVVFSHGTDIEAGTRSKWKKTMLNFVCENSEQIVFNSENLKKRLLRILPELENKSSVLYPCPEPMFFEPVGGEKIAQMKAQYALEGKHVMLSIARLTDGKGITHLVRILPKILESVPNLVWFLIGDGPKRQFLIQEIQKNNLQNVVRLVGEVKHEELNSFYHLADLFVLLTHPDEGREEGLGMVFLEAAAAGLPVVAGKSGGVEEAVINGQTGIIVDIYKGDKIIADSIVEMLKNPDFAKRLAENARDRVRTDFKWESQMKVIERWI
ncbi:MAG: glycosyltransferase family 4 protein [Candidatus Magasanikiibacteriota bacterium]